MMSFTQQLSSPNYYVLIFEFKNEHYLLDYFFSNLVKTNLINRINTNA